MKCIHLIRSFFVAIVVLMLLGGCTRSLQTSSISIDTSAFRKQSQSTGEYFYLVLNITGIAKPIYASWEEDQIPQQYTVQLDSGTQPLIQILGVSRNTLTNTLTFKYGDARPQITAGGQQQVDIELVAVPGQSREGELIGRYLTASNPTGKVAMKFKPTGKPAMTVLQEEIFGGWINSFVILNGDAKLHYSLIDSNGSETSLFENLHLDSTDMGGSDSLMRVRFPATAYRVFNSNEPPELIGSQVILFGYFGSTAGKKACFNNSPSQISNLFSDAQASTPIVWSSSPTATEAGPEAGGVEASSCTGMTAYENALTFDHSSFSFGGSPGFEGPYKHHPSGNMNHEKFLYSQWDESTSNLTLEWSYLPGIFQGEGSITGSAIFYSTNYQGTNESLLDHGTNSQCGNYPGFQRILKVGASNQVSIANVTRQMLEEDKLKIVICPYRVTNGKTEYFDSGLETHGFHNLTQPRPVFKIVGSSVSDSEIQNANSVVNGVDRLVKTRFTNGYHTLLVTLGQQQIMATEVGSLQFSIDGGAWTSFSAGASPSVNFGGGSISGVGLSDSSISTALSSSSDQTVRFKAVLNSPSNFNLTDAEYISPEMTLVGSANCNSPTLKVLRLTDGAVLDSSTFLSSLNTSHNESYKLIWTGESCGNATAVLDYMSLSGSPVCLQEKRDIYFDPGKPFAFRVDPKDTLAADCSFNSHGPSALSLYTPSNAGVEVFSKSFSGETLVHSTTANKLGAFLVGDNPSTPVSPYNLGVIVKKWIGSIGDSVQLKVAKLNDDDRLVSLTGSAFPASISSWNILGSHFNLSSSTTNYPALTMSANSDLKAHNQSYISDGLGGALLTATRGSSHAVEFVSDQLFWGHSPLFTTRDGSNVHFNFLPNNNGQTEGHSVKTLSNSVSTANRVFVQPLYRNFGAYDFEYFAVAFANTLYIVAVSHSNLNDYWSNPITLTNAAEVIGLSRRNDMNGDLQVFAKKSSTNTLIYYQIGFGPYSFDGTSWTSNSSEASTGEVTTMIPFDAAKCGGGDIAVIGSDSSDASIAKTTVFALNNISTPLVSYASAAAFLGAQNRGACMRYVGALPTEPIYTSLYYSDSASSSSIGPKMISHNFSGSSQCGMTTNQTAAPDTSSVSSSLISTHSTLKGFKSGQRYNGSGINVPYVFIGVPTASQTQLYRLTGNCGAGLVLGLDHIGSTSGHIEYLNHMHQDEGDRHAWIFKQGLGLLELFLD